MKAIHTKYYGPRDKKGSRIIARDGDGNRVEWEVMNTVNLISNHGLAALKLCLKMKWGGVYYEGWLREGEHVFVTPTGRSDEASAARYDDGFQWFGTEHAQLLGIRTRTVELTTTSPPVIKSVEGIPLG